MVDVLWGLHKEIEMTSRVIKKLKSGIDIKIMHDELFNMTDQSFETWKPGVPGHGHVWEKTGIRIITNGADDQLAREKAGKEPTIWHYDYPELHKFFKWFTDTYGGTVRKANYYTTPPGSGVVRHFDSHPYFIDKDRFHLVLSGQYKYTVHGETEVCSKGDLWWFNNKLEHGSYNHGTEDKINLVFDVAGLRT